MRQFCLIWFYLYAFKIAVQLLHLAVVVYPKQRSYTKAESVLDLVFALSLAGWLAFLLWGKP